MVATQCHHRDKNFYSDPNAQGWYNGQTGHSWILKPATENKSGLVRGCLQLLRWPLLEQVRWQKLFLPRQFGFVLSSSSIQRTLTMGLPTLKPGTAMAVGALCHRFLCHHHAERHPSSQTESIFTLWPTHTHHTHTHDSKCSCLSL